MSSKSAVTDREYLAALCRTVPYTVVESVLADPREAALRSLEFEGTVMFADLAGFTSLCEELAAQGAEGLTRLSGTVDQIFTRLLEQAIFPFRGYVIHFGGDSITTVFRDEDHAARAAAAALEAQRQMDVELSTLVEGNQRSRLRIGLATGPIRLSLMGDLTQRGLVCAGPPAHRAIVMQQRAEPGAVMADAGTLRQLGGRVQVSAASAEQAVLVALNEKVARRPPFIPLEGRIEQDAKAKIALLEPFVPRPLAARLRSTPAGWRMEGELRRAVIMFVELSRLEAAGSEVVLNLSRALMRAYRKYDGLVAKTDLAEQGHRIMVLFGLLMPSAFDAERALLAALEATARVRSYAASSGLQASVRSGVHVGQVYFGTVGSDYRHDITVLGDAVNVAARIAAAAEPFAVLASEEVLASTGREFSVSARAAVHAKGKRMPLKVAAVNAPATGVAHYLQPRRRVRFLTGRAAQGERVRRLAEEAMAGTARILGVAGGQGTGKSAFLSSAIDTWLHGGGMGLFARCRYATSAQPLAPIVSMFETYFGLVGAPDDADQRERVRAGLAGLNLDEVSPELEALLLPVRRPDGSLENSVDLTDSQARERVLASIVQFIDRRSAREPVLYVIEDLHLADSLTLDLVGRVSGLYADRRLFSLLTYEPTANLSSLRRGLSEEISLGNLDAEQTRELLCHELGAASVETGLLAFLHRRSGGNPGHLVEILRFLRERGFLTMRAGVLHGPAGGVALLD
ncbi:MAG: AAA family ATPase, partial [Deltaproteobacteria bacterium]|nr:AAA family ATPase [Deltaproteobacteria bacterium]